MYFARLPPEASDDWQGRTQPGSSAAEKAYIGVTAYGDSGGRSEQLKKFGSLLQGPTTAA